MCRLVLENGDPSTKSKPLGIKVRHFTVIAAECAKKNNSFEPVASVQGGYMCRLLASWHRMYENPHFVHTKLAIRTCTPPCIACGDLRSALQVEL